MKDLKTNQKKRYGQLHIVTGGSGSGKSEYAEELLKEYSTDKYYIATMNVADEESELRVKRHRAMREGKNFVTIEAPMALTNAADRLPSNAVVLLECMSNLVANEMFMSDKNSGLSTGDLELNSDMQKEIYHRVISGVEAILLKASVLVIVTNEIFSDGCCYDETTNSYIRLLGKINCKLADMADTVTEVVYSIPVNHKS